MGNYVYYEDDFEPKGPSLFQRFLRVCLFLISVHAFVMQLVALLISCGMISYMIFKALKTNDKEKQAELLMATVLFNLITLAEYFLSWLLKFVPLYYELKVVLFIWLLHPKSQGAKTIYTKFVAPQLGQVEKQVDENVDKISKQASPYMDKAVSTVQTKLDQAKQNSTSADGKLDPDSLYAKISGKIDQANTYLEPPVTKKTQ